MDILHYGNSFLETQEGVPIYHGSRAFDDQAIEV